MRKYLVLFVALVTLFFSSCEKDDFCTSPLTPKLVLRFYDNAGQTKFKNVLRLSAIAQGKTDSLFTNQEADSIALPLNTLADQTIYKLKMNSVDGNKSNNKTNTLTVAYTTEEVFVSRSCGFRTIFKTVTITSDNGWFISLTPSQLTNITNETAAHVKVYH